jgi:mRNA-degrading endonuclease YafQ of YafQ-DinJ toxin-antitoxin module
MKILQTASFQKSVKKLHANQKKDLDQAVKAIVANPDLGDSKVGDLAGVCVYKFKMVSHLTLLAYAFDGKAITLTLLALGSHENFYRDLKRQ